jgi:prepilin-type N-terminal cleavage/methylation domain-containing protein
MKTKSTYLKISLIKGDVWKTGGFWAKAFTLVELIVVITILAILWTIAFLSFQWYSSNARDSTRWSDLSSIVSSLEMFYTKSWFYPSTNNGVNITYSWSLAWEQGTFWDNQTKQAGWLN